MVAGFPKPENQTPKKTAFYDRLRNVVQYGRKKQATPRRLGITSLFDTACGIGFRALYACRTRSPLRTNCILTTCQCTFHSH